VPGKQSAAHEAYQPQPASPLTSERAATSSSLTVEADDVSGGAGEPGKTTLHLGHAAQAVPAQGDARPP
jgi:hypothetical protein